MAVAVNTLPKQRAGSALHRRPNERMSQPFPAAPPSPAPAMHFMHFTKASIPSWKMAS